MLDKFLPVHDVKAVWDSEDIKDFFAKTVTEQAIFLRNNP